MKKESAELKQDKIKSPTAEKSVTTKRKQKVTKTVYIEANGNQTDVEDLKKKAEEGFLKLYPNEKIQDLKLYINTNEGNAYYVVNGKTDCKFMIVI